MGGLFRSQKPQPAVAPPPGPADEGGAPVITGFRHAQPWFGDSQADYRVFFWDLGACPTVETDELGMLKLILSKPEMARFQMVIYQNFLRERGGSLAAFWFDKATARELAQAVKGSQVRHLFILCTTFEEGALTELAGALSPQTLESLGIFYCFSGDDLTDEAGHPEEIGAAARSLKVRRLCVFTAAFNDHCEESLLRGLGDWRLAVCRVAERDEANLYPLFPTPRLDAACSAS